MTDPKMTTNRVYREFTVLSVGDMEKGFTFYGPFVDVYESVNWAKANVRQGELVKPVQVRDVTLPEETT
jgi:hypothetical protein